MSRTTRFAFLYLLCQVAFLSHYAQTTNFAGEPLPIRWEPVIETPAFVAPPALYFAVSGPSPVAYGSSHVYTVSGATATSWTCTCGSVDAWSGTNVTIIFDNPSCSIAYITAVGTGFAALGVSVTGGTLAGGAISNTSQTINNNTIPTQISASVATGGTCSSYSYQWYSSPNNSTYTSISGATGQNYQPGALTATTYYKRLTTCGSSTAYTSNVAVVTVYPAIGAGSISPSSQTITYGGTPSTLTLSGVTGGNSSYSYQWQSSPDNTFSTPTNVGSGTTTYTPPSSATSTLYYRVVVTSNGASGNSLSAVVTVYPAIAAGSISPSSQTINNGSTPSTLTLSGVSGGSGTYTYQWQSSTDNTFSSPTNVGSGTTTYTPSSGATSTLYYRVVVTSNGVSAPSSSAVVTVYPAIGAGSITPSSQAINNGGTPSTLTLSGVSGGNGTYSYQWQSSPDNIFSSPTNVGSGTTTYTPPPGATSTLYYRVVVTSNGASANSLSAVVTVYPPVVGGTITPSSQTANYGGSASMLTLSGVSGGSGTYTYQWQSSTNSYFSTRTNVGSGTTTFTPTGATSVLYYRVTVTSNGAFGFSSTAVVNLYPPLLGGDISPATQSVNYGGSPSTLVLLSPSGGIGTYTYQWQSSPDNTFNSPTNVGSGAATYTPPLGATSTLYYRVVVTSNGASTNSNMAVVNVIPQLAAGTISGNTGPINYNTSPGLLGSTQDATGGTCSGSYTYQWQYSADSTNYRTIAGASASTYTPVNLTVSTYFRRQVNCGDVSLYSNVLYVQVTPQRAATCTMP